MGSVNLVLSAPQDDYLDCDYPFQLFVGGLGSGKTFASCLKCAILSRQNPDVMIAFYEPTYHLFRLVVIPAFEKVFALLGIKYHHDKQANILSLNPGGQILLKSMHIPETIEGYEVGYSFIDELDTMARSKGELAFKNIVNRNRAKLKDGKKNYVMVSTTPEGFHICYNLFVKKADKNKKIIVCTTYDNSDNLPEGYIDNLKSIYDKSALSAYLSGMFVNLTSHAVYRNFDRYDNHTNVIDDGVSTLHVGMDFNVTNMSATVDRVIDDVPHVFDEFTGVFDTPAMIRVLTEKYPDRTIIVYPDASGKARKTVGASVSDISLLKEHRNIIVKAKNFNPRVKDRVTSLRRMIKNANNEIRFFVNTATCPNLTECLEQQVYDKNNEPDKSSDNDHLNDAIGYRVYYQWPIVSGKVIIGRIR